MYLVLPDMHSLSGISCHSICQFCYSKDYVYDHSFSKICNFLFLSLRSNSPHAMPDAMLYIHTAYHLTCFFISPPPVWAGICRTARQSCLIPYSTLSRCNIPRTPLRLPCSPAEVSLSPGFQGRMPPLPHAGNAAHIFPSSVTIPCFTCTKALPPAFHRQIFLREALPSSPE